MKFKLCSVFFRLHMSWQDNYRVCIHRPRVDIFLQNNITYIIFTPIHVYIFTIAMKCLSIAFPGIAFSTLFFYNVSVMYIRTKKIIIWWVMEATLLKSANTTKKILTCWLFRFCLLPAYAYIYGIRFVGVGVGVGVWSLSPEYFLNCLPENQVVCPNITCFFARKWQFEIL